MKKELFIKGETYNYEGIPAYCYGSQRLVLADGRLITRTASKYSPDVISNGHENKGYLRVKIDGKYQFVHRLVAFHFLPNPGNLPVVDHINENKEDNRVANLQWSTLESNAARTYIRDNRALNEARKELSKARELREHNKAIQKDIADEEEALEVLHIKLKHVRAVITKELEELLSSHVLRVDRLLEITQGEISKKETRRLSTLKKVYRTKLQVVEELGKKIKVSGKVFPSIRAASRYIASEEFKLGNTRSVHTIRKELKRVQIGVRLPGDMYGAYSIDLV